MPKTFSDSERAYIRQKLTVEAEFCLAQFGIKKTTVDELVNRAGIPKGTFYLFYDSKELLFFEVFNKIHDEIHADLLEQIQQMPVPVSPNQLTDLMAGLFVKMESSFLYRLMMDGEFEMLMRRLPPEVTLQHAEKDNLSIEMFISMVPGIKAERVQVFSAALRGIFLSMLHKREIGEAVFNDALILTLRGIVIQMFEEDSK